jgi:hypothetical protein
MRTSDPWANIDALQMNISDPTPALCAQFDKPLLWQEPNSGFRPVLPLAEPNEGLNGLCQKHLNYATQPELQMQQMQIQLHMQQQQQLQQQDKQYSMEKRMQIQDQQYVGQQQHLNEQQQERQPYNRHQQHQSVLQVPHKSPQRQQSSTVHHHQAHSQLTQQIKQPQEQQRSAQRVSFPERGAAHFQRPRAAASVVTHLRPTAPTVPTTGRALQSPRTDKVAQQQQQQKHQQFVRARVTMPVQQFREFPQQFSLQQRIHPNISSSLPHSGAWQQQSRR